MATTLSVAAKKLLVDIAKAAPGAAKIDVTTRAAKELYNRLLIATQVGPEGSKAFGQRMQWVTLTDRGQEMLP